MRKKSQEQKRQAKLRAKAKRRQHRQAKRPSSSPMPFLDLIPFGDPPGVPQGFRPIPMTQAMMEFAAPIMAYVENGTVPDPNDALQIGMQLWNVTLPKVPASQKQPRTEIVTNISTTLQMERQEADAFFDRMIERKAYLFPDEIQPEGSMTMFMRKEVEYLITKFEESQLNLPNDPVPPDPDDETFLKALRRLDAQIAEGAYYEEWEEDFFAMEELCCQRYQRWLQAKGVPETYSRHFPFCLKTYLSFIYQYDSGELKDVSLQALEEFMMDYLLRKVMAKPPEYTHWPPALRLFYRFLSEKGYLDDPERIMARLTSIEPDFIALVKRRS
jgi:hypothetical protein